MVSSDILISPKVKFSNGYLGNANRPCTLERRLNSSRSIEFDRTLELDYSDHMTREQLVEIVKKLLETDSELDFLSKLTKSELETLVAAVRNRVEKFG